MTDQNTTLGPTHAMQLGWPAGQTPCCGKTIDQFGAGELFSTEAAEVTCPTVLNDPALKAILDAAPRPEPEWLTRLRAEMQVELDCAPGTPMAYVADRATGLAASYLHQVHDDASKLKCQMLEIAAEVRGAPAGIWDMADPTELAAQIRSMRERVAELDDLKAVQHTATLGGWTVGLAWSELDSGAITVNIDATTDPDDPVERIAVHMNDEQLFDERILRDEDHTVDDSDEWLPILKARMLALEVEGRKVFRFAAVRVAHGMLKEAHETIAARDAEIEELKTGVAWRADRLQALNGIVDSQADTIDQMQRELRANDTVIGSLNRKVAELESENADRLKELEAYDDGYKGERWGLPEVMPGHIAAYRKAYVSEARKYAEAPVRVVLDECIRAGLTAVQWVPLAEPVQPSPVTTTFAGPPGIMASVAYNLASDRPSPDRREVHAFRFDGTGKGHEAADNWGGRFVESDYFSTFTGDYRGVHIRAHGRQGQEMGIAGAGDWIIYDTDHGFSIVGSAEFAGLYEATADPDVFTEIAPQPSPEMREVPAGAGQIREGDTARLSAVVLHVEDDWINVGFPGVCEHIITIKPSIHPDLVITRPVSPLPDKPGAVGTATVRGIKGVRVARATDSELPWTALTVDVARDDVFWLADHEISDYVPLLDGQEGS